MWVTGWKPFSLNVLAYIILSIKIYSLSSHSKHYQLRWYCIKNAGLNTFKCLALWAHTHQYLPEAQTLLDIPIMHISGALGHFSVWVMNNSCFERDKSVLQDTSCKLPWLFGDSNVFMIGQTPRNCSELKNQTLKLSCPYECVISRQIGLQCDLQRCSVGV